MQKSIRTDNKQARQIVFCDEINLSYGLKVSLAGFASYNGEKFISNL